MPSAAESKEGSRHNVKMPELLAPAGSFAKMITAIHYGADAVYCGGKKFSLRAHAGNFSNRELAAAVAYAHEKNVRLYVTVNIFAHREDMRGLEDYFLYLRDIAVDGIIVSDPGILALAREIIPEVAIHLSTQANVTNPANAKFWEGQGVARINLARELSLAEIVEIRQNLAARTGIEIFVHGALCISYSGRCLLSCYLTGRDANRGECAHPCRYNYRLMEEKRPGQYFPVEEDEHGTYIFNSKDLCLLEKLPQLVDAGVNSLKIEGRMKSVYYVGGVVRVYRAALDYIAERLKDDRPGGRGIILPPLFMEELLKVGTRGYTENFLLRSPGAEDMLYDRPRTEQEYVPVGVVLNVGNNAAAQNWLEVEIRNPLKKGEMLEYLGRNLTSHPFEVTGLFDQDSIPLQQANPGNIVKVAYRSGLDIAWEVNGLLRKRR